MSNDEMKAIARWLHAAPTRRAVTITASTAIDGGVCVDVCDTAHADTTHHTQADDIFGAVQAAILIIDGIAEAEK